MKLFVFVIGLPVFLSIGSPAVRAGDVENLKAVFERGVEALNKRDLDGFLATVHEKGLSFYSCGPTSAKEGKAACQQDWEQFFASSGSAKFAPENAQFRVIGNTGVAWGDYKVSVRGKDGTEKSYAGRYTLIYTKDGGKWLLAFQENSPLMAADQTRTTAQQSGHEPGRVR